MRHRKLILLIVALLAGLYALPTQSQDLQSILKLDQSDDLRELIDLEIEDDAPAEADAPDATIAGFSMERIR